MFFSILVNNMSSKKSTVEVISHERSRRRIGLFLSLAPDGRSYSISMESKRMPNDPNARPLSSPFASLDIPGIEVAISDSSCRILQFSSGLLGLLQIPSDELRCSSCSEVLQHHMQCMSCTRNPLAGMMGSSGEQLHPEPRLGLCVPLLTNELHLSGGMLHLILQSKQSSACGTSNRMSGKVWDSLFHELNNAMAVVLGCAHLMSRDGPERFSENLDALGQAALRCQELMDRGRMMVSTQRPHTDHVPVDLNQVLEEIVKIYHGSSRTFSALQSVDIELDLDEGLPMIPGDPLHLHQVFQNLFVNAVQAAKNGEKHPWVRISSRSIGKGVAVRVEDNGPGVPQGMEQQIFEAYVTTKPPDQGTGLGLSVAKELIKKHGGNIRVLTDRAAGACFEVLLPTREETYTQINTLH